MHGKGEALWKSLHVLKGDIVAWIDTDIRNIHPRFVYGLIGPFLKDQRVQFVKGFYKRPIRGPGGVLQSTGGGRVTELMARPMMNLFYPELSGLIQPLAGEQAGRRAVLEQLPFFTGYGVETGLLIDLLLQYGLRAIGQVDLKRRVHRNQSLASLSVMSFVILQVVMKRLEQRHRLQLLSEVNTTMKLIQHERDRFHVELREVGDVERPPIALIPEYQAAHPPRPRRGQPQPRPGELARLGEGRPAPMSRPGSGRPGDGDHPLPPRPDRLERPRPLPGAHGRPAERLRPPAGPRPGRDAGGPAGSTSSTPAPWSAPTTRRWRSPARVAWRSAATRAWTRSTRGSGKGCGTTRSCCTTRRSWRPGSTTRSTCGCRRARRWKRSGCGSARPWTT